MAKISVSIEQLLNRLNKSNLAEKLDEEKISQIALRCVLDYEIDEQSRSEWLEKSKEALDLAMQVCTTKNFPWEGSANVKYPLLTIAALQFHARAYPAIIMGNQIVKGQVTGADPDGKKMDKALRIGKFMSYQLLDEMDGWEEDMDRLLITLPILGCMFKKTYFDQNKKKNVSSLVFPQQLVINYKAKSLYTAPRITHLFTLYPQEIIERQMQGIFLDTDIAFGDEQNTETPQEMLEQHCLIDLDEDGYKEPYIVTIHKATSRLLRLVANYDMDTIFVKIGDEFLSIETLKQKGMTDFSSEKLAHITPVAYFTKFQFFPSPDGGIYDFGFGQMLLPLIETINTSINQMLDAGTAQNTGGGFVTKGLLTDKKGNMSFAPGEFKQVDNLTGGSIRDSIYPLTHPGPSGVTFSLLAQLIMVVKEMTSVQDIMVGGADSQETATTTLSRVEQGMKLFAAIYKRIYRSMKSEFKKLKRLNKHYLPISQYYQVLDSGMIDNIGLLDFQGDDTEVQPIADPTIASLPLKLAKVQILKQVSANNPLYNQREVENRFLEAMEEPNIDKLLLAEEQVQPPPNPKMLQVQGQLEKIMAEISRMQTEKVEMGSRIMLNLANAAKAEAGNQFEEYKLQMEALKQEMEAMRNGMPNEQRGNGGMEKSPAITGSIEDTEGIPPMPATAIEPGGLPENGQPGENRIVSSPIGGGL